MASPPQGSSDALVEHPANCKVNCALSVALPSESIEPVHGGQVLREPGFHEFRIGPPQIVATENRIDPHSSGQQAPAQRSIPQRRNLVFAAIGQKIDLDSPLEQIV